MAKIPQGETFFHMWRGPKAPYQYMLQQEHFVVDVEDRNILGQTALTKMTSFPIIYSRGLLGPLLDVTPSLSVRNHSDHQGFTPLHLALKREISTSLLDLTELERNGELSDLSCDDCSLISEMNSSYEAASAREFELCAERCYKKHAEFWPHMFLMTWSPEWHRCPRMSHYEEMWRSDIKQLLQSGADVHAVAHSGQTPLDCVIGFGRGLELRLWIKTLVELEFDLHEYGRRETTMRSFRLVRHLLRESEKSGRPYYRCAPMFQYGKSRQDLKVWTQYIYDWEADFDHDSYTLNDFYALASNTIAVEVVVTQQPALCDDQEEVEEIAQAVLVWVMKCLRAKRRLLHLIRRTGLSDCLLTAVAIWLHCCFPFIYPLLNS